MADLDARVAAFLAEHTTMTVATSGAVDVRAAALFYAHTPELNLVFVSDEDTRHAQDINRYGQVAVTIHQDGQAWESIRGLQMTGRCNRVTGVERAAALEIYLAKFQEIKALRDAPVSSDGARVMARLMVSDFYMIQPMWIRLIDNSLGFGHKEELILERP